MSWLLCESGEVVLVEDTARYRTDHAHHAGDHLPAELARRDSGGGIEDFTITLASSDGPAQEDEEGDEDHDGGEVEIRAQLLRSEPDEDAAEAIEEPVAHELGSCDAHALG